jgi:hypothetical protein
VTAVHAAVHPTPLRDVPTVISSGPGHGHCRPGGLGRLNGLTKDLDETGRCRMTDELTVRLAQFVSVSLERACSDIIGTGAELLHFSGAFAPL